MITNAVSAIGTFETGRRTLKMSAYQGKTGSGRPTAKTALLTQTGNSAPGQFNR
jgi:hypothetical protein